LITTGGSEALLLTCLSILDPYTEVIIPEPYYPNYTTFVHAAGGVIRALPTNPWEGYRYAKRERIESLITKNTRAILITNPGNPTGVVLDENEMRMIADIAKAHDLYLICDEVYREFCYDEKFGVPTMARFPDIQDNLVIVDSVSKRFSACGARVGCVVTKNKELQQAILKFCQSRLSVATIDQIGAEALYSVDPEFFRKSKQEYRLRRDTVISGLRKIPGVVVEEPMGAFYVMASLPVDDSDKFQHWLLDSFDDDGDTVMFAPGAPFYETPGKGINEVRIAYVLNREDLNRAMEVLARGIARYQREVMQINPKSLG
ncbi:MAG: pyridoxal phosphate-dependent aminotransferase, partial [Faecousia sp.]